MLTTYVDKLKDVAIIRCAGRLTRGEGIRALKNAVISRDESRLIVLDLSEVESVDAAGLTALVSLHHWTRSHNIALKLSNPSKFVLEMLDRTKLSSVLQISSFHDALVAIVGRSCSDEASPNPCREQQAVSAGV